MKIFLSIAALLVASAAGAQDYPLKVERPKPLTSTLVGVCENRHPALMVAVFTFENGKVLVVDGKHMQGFSSAVEIVQYAATAGEVHQYAQQCGDTTT